MGYSKGSFDFTTGSGTSNFPQQLGLTNVGFSVYVLERGEGFDYLHNHREQEEIYFCIEGTAELVIRGEAELIRVELARGEAVKVEPQTLRAIGNSSSERSVVIIAGGCPHPYPAGQDDHVISDVHTIVGHGETGFTRPSYLAHNPAERDAEDC
ncbi:MAG: cupin domain-containing protein [Myxococcota bacterium]